jgi:2-amino-4-hydroxy-6-hydroxymethyldihydropteridine diphosphokinase
VIVYESHLIQLGFIDRRRRGRVGTYRVFEYFQIPPVTQRHAEYSVLKTAYISLGSNLGDRHENLRKAIELLEAADIHVLRRSSLYQTEPQDLKAQPWFLNAVAEVETKLFPMQLLARIQNIERQLGRKRTVPKGPRTIDIDILLYGSFVIETIELQIPHPRFTERRFVLEPLLELAPDLRHPVTRRRVRELLAATAGQVVRKLPENSSC